MPEKLTLPPWLTEWDGFEDPNFTPIPDSFFDLLLTLLTDVEVRVLLYIMRRTYGFKKAADSISLSQIVNGITKRDGTRLDRGAGVKKSGACVAVQRLEARGILLVQRNTSPTRGYEATTYRVRKAGIPLVQQTDKGSSPLVHQTDKPLSVVHTSLVHVTDKQETGVQETDSQDDSNPPAPQRNRLQRRNNANTPPATDEGGASPPSTERDPSTPLPAGPYSAYIAGILQDHSAELGDSAHWPANVTQALRLWHASGLDEAAFVAHLHEARRRVRTYQGKQGQGTITNKMAYYFRCLAEGVGAPTELGPRR